MHKYVIILAAVLLGFTCKAQQTQQSYWQQQVDYIIDVTLNDEKHELTGDIAITYINNSPDVLQEIYIHLWPNAYKNNETAFAKQMLENGETEFYYAKENERGEMSDISFSANGKTLVAEATEYIDVIKVVLTEPLTSGEKRTLFTKFTVKVPKVFSRLGHEGQNYFITQWYPKPAVYDVNGWNPMPYLNQGEFYAEFGSFKVAVTLPDNYTVVATGQCMTAGELASEKVAVDTVPVSSTSTKTIRFEADNVHDFAWFASKQWGYVTKEIDLGATKVLARVVATEPDKKDLEHIETAIKYYSDNVGMYPYSHATVVHGELKAGGGMEYPMITLCDFMSEEVIIHEVGHNWFYGILANNERAYPWMDESINSYYEGEAMAQNKKPGLGDINTTIMMAFVRDKYLTNDYQPIASTSEELTGANYGLCVYGLGAKSFGYLKAYLSADLFRECMRTYYDTWKYKHPLPDDMKRSFEATSGENLSWFFDEILTSTGKLDYRVKKHKEGFELANIGAINAPVPVTFMKGDKASVEWFNVKPGEKLVITKDSSVTLAVIDVKSKTLDLFADNNSSKAPFKLKLGSGRDKANAKEVYWLPTLGWNAYDRMMVGVGVHNYALSDKPFQYHVLPMYSFEKKTVNGTAGVEYIQALKGASQYLELGITAKKFSFQERIRTVRDNDGFTEANYNYVKIKPYVVYHFPKVNMRSTHSKRLSLALDQVFLNPQFDFVDSDTLPGPAFFQSNQRSFATLSYVSENKRVLNGYYFEGSLEYGRITNDRVSGEKVRTVNLNNDSINVFPKVGSDQDVSDFLKLSGLYKYGLDIGIKDKPLEFRFFATYLLKRSNNDIYNNHIGSSDKAGHYDYKFDDFLLHRNAQDGMFQNQIDNSANASKFVGSIGIPDKWIVSGSITLPLPGKIPIKPYVEFLVYDELSSQQWNISESKMIFNAGLEIEIVKDRFEIFLNLAQSKDVTNYQDGTIGGLPYPGTIDTFGERITFVLDLNGLRPNKIKKQLKLF
jgi:hypothetical protein